ncbi:hypothetical protein GCM10023145_11860 [Angustibacter luteus]
MGLVVVLGAVAVASTATAGDAGAATPVPSVAGSAAIANVARAQAQCDLGVTAARPDDAARAGQIMAGRVPIEKYGTVLIPRNPTWRPQAGLDSSGDGHMNSLHYLVPLLREGVRTGNRAMVDRFYGLLRDWGTDNRLTLKKRPNGYGWQPIYTGYRMQVIGCALAGPRGREPWLRRLAAVHANYVTTYTSTLASNNTGIQLAMGQYVLGCSMGHASWRNAARGRLSRLVTHLVYADGSTREGAVSYATSDYAWFRLAGQRLRRCGTSVPSGWSRVDAIARFVGNAIRPDGSYEALGDTSPQRPSVSTYTGTAAEWSARLGAGGTRPVSPFAIFRSGGYAFGRSGWGTATRPFTQQSFYSLRFGAGPGAGIFHAHADAGALTFYANGSELLHDTGQWRYQYGATRTFVTGRDAHNVVSASGGGYSTTRAAAVTAVLSDAHRDLVTIVDTGYRKNKITLTRTVLYSRSGEYLVVWDRAVSALKDAKGHVVPRQFAQHWQLGPGQSTLTSAGQVSTSGPGANTTLVWLGTRPRVTVSTGSTSPRRGWVSPSYGKLTPAPAVRASLGPATVAGWVTVVLPRPAGTAPSAVAASAQSLTSSRLEVTVRTASGRSERVVLTRSAASVSEVSGAVAR